MAEESNVTFGGADDGLMTRSGRISFSGERSLWFHGYRRKDFEAVAPLIEALRTRFARLDFVFTAADPSIRQWLAQRFPNTIVLSPPLALGFCAGRYLVNLDVRLLMMLGTPRPHDRFILQAAHRRATPIVLAQTEAAEGSETAKADLASYGTDVQKFQHCFVTSRAAQAFLTRALEDGKVSRISFETAAESASSDAEMLSIVAPLLGRDLKLIRSNQRPLRRRLENLALRCMDHPGLRRWLSFKVERLDTIDQLRDRLGNPGTILCLGNGPSSEAPEVGEATHDCLFRVNHGWLSRGFLIEPDMVFSGSKASLAVVRGAIFGLQSIQSEGRLLVTRFLRPQFRRVCYATIERFGLYLNEPRWEGIRPTNGAAMLAAAVALQPPRLIIAGIDLFSHPAGTYPGDRSTPNAYSPGHDAESELALLLEALSLYEGELIILSPALKERWESHQREPMTRHDAAG